MHSFFDSYPYQIVLASGSPRRQQFFKDLGIPFTSRVRSLEEVYPETLKREDIAVYLAKLKASVFTDLSDEELLITSDTVVWCENESLAKAENAAEATQMLQKLSGKTHEVITAVFFKTTRFEKVITDITQVTFKKLSVAEINYYLEMAKPYDKAGAYGIQDWIGLIGVERLEGSFFNVMGLPTHKVYATLMEIKAGKF
ncbi:MAG: septum formation protein Maf [Bacteroidetes bacterium]|nr:septum formation protein Maf [Bacteroidota bacterium]